MSVSVTNSVPLAGHTIHPYSSGGQNYLYIIGGYNALWITPDAISSAIYKITLNTNSMAAVSTIPTPSADHVSVLWSTTSILVYGGYDGNRATLCLFCINIDVIEAYIHVVHSNSESYFIRIQSSEQRLYIFHS